MDETIEFLARGGPIMVPIGLCSVLALALFLERIWALQRQRVVPGRFLDVVRELLRQGKTTEAATLAASNESMLGGVLAAGLRHAAAGRAVVREAMQDRGRRAIGEMERFTGMLGGIVSISPLLGLLGTVTGMIKTFKAVNDTILETGQVNPGALASGIWEAMITTAAGLVVAIPALVAHRYIMGRIDRLAGELEEIALDVVDLVSDPVPATRDAGSPLAAPPAPADAPEAAP